MQILSFDHEEGSESDADPVAGPNATITGPNVEGI